MTTVTDQDMASPTPKDFARNSGEIMVEAGNPDHIKSVADLANSSLKVVTCAPEVPCGARSMTAGKSGLPLIHPLFRYIRHESTPAYRRDIDKEHLMRLSARNQIPARITSINSGEAIANVELDAGGIRLVASITVEAVSQLGLAEGTDVIAVIKASDVMVAIG
jgi:molybdopterin-binding protein